MASSFHVLFSNTQFSASSFIFYHLWLVAEFRSRRYGQQALPHLICAFFVASTFHVLFSIHSSGPKALYFTVYDWLQSSGGCVHTVNKHFHIFSVHFSCPSVLTWSCQYTARCQQFYIILLFDCLYTVNKDSHLYLSIFHGLQECGVPSLMHCAVLGV